MIRVSLRLDFVAGKLGPGKIALLEKIAETGSISAAARALSMSYKRAWDLVEAVNRLFPAPLVSTQTGGRRGGGAGLTPAGEDVVRRFRAIEKAAIDAANALFDATATHGN